MARTFEERAELTRQILFDPDLKLGIVESYQFLWKWFRFEMSIRRFRKARASYEAAKLDLNIMVEQFEFRCELNDL